MKPCVVGRGRVGDVLALALRAQHVASRALPDALDADVYVLAVRDPALPDTAREVLSRHVGPAPIVLHTAGGVPSSRVRLDGVAGAAVMHPLRAFAGSGSLPPDTLFAIEGDATGRVAAEAIVASLSGRTLILDESQLARYHAAAVLASNHVLALVDLGRAMLEDLGVDRAIAATAIASLFEGVAANLAAIGLPRALTGPVSRGDVAAVERHLGVLEGEARDAYLVTARRLVAIAREQGADPAALDRIAALLYPPAHLV